MTENLPAKHADALDISTLVQIVTDECNHHVLRHLQDSEASEVSVGELAKIVAERHRGDLQRHPMTARIRLHHEALPNLSDLGLLSYYPDSGIVRTHLDRIPDDPLENMCAPADAP